MNLKDCSHDLTKFTHDSSSSTLVDVDYVDHLITCVLTSVDNVVACINPFWPLSCATLKCIRNNNGVDSKTLNILFTANSPVTCCSRFRKKYPALVQISSFLSATNLHATASSPASAGILNALT